MSDELKQLKLVGLEKGSEWLSGEVPVVSLVRWFIKRTDNKLDDALEPLLVGAFLNMSFTKVFHLTLNGVSVECLKVYLEGENVVFHVNTSALIKYFPAKSKNKVDDPVAEMVAKAFEKFRFTKDFYLKEQDVVVEKGDEDESTSAEEVSESSTSQDPKLSDEE